MYEVSGTVGTVRHGTARYGTVRTGTDSLRYGLYKIGIPSHASTGNFHKKKISKLSVTQKKQKKQARFKSSYFRISGILRIGIFNPLPRWNTNAICTERPKNSGPRSWSLLYLTPLHVDNYKQKTQTTTCVFNLYNIEYIRCIKKSDFDVFRWAGTVTRDKRLTLVGNNGSIRRWY